MDENATEILFQPPAESADQAPGTNTDEYIQNVLDESRNLQSDTPAKKRKFGAREYYNYVPLKDTHAKIITDSYHGAGFCYACQYGDPRNNKATTVGKLLELAEHFGRVSLEVVAQIIANEYELHYRRFPDKETHRTVILEEWPAQQVYRHLQQTFNPALYYTDVAITLKQALDQLQEDAIAFKCRITGEKGIHSGNLKLYMQTFKVMDLAVQRAKEERESKNTNTNT